MWQAGFWSVLRNEDAVAPQGAMGVSAGAAIGLLCLCEAIDAARESILLRVERNQRNVQLSQLVRRRRPFPHENMFRAALHDAIDEGVFQKICRGVPFYVVVAESTARWRWAQLAGASVASFNFLVRRSQRGMGRIADVFGLQSTIMDVRKCPSRSDLIDLLTDAIRFPPLLSYPSQNGRFFLDAGMLNPLPTAFAVATLKGDGPVLALATQPMPPEGNADFLIVGPSRPLEVGRLDYTSEKTLETAFDLGARDAVRFLDGYDPSLTATGTP